MILTIVQITPQLQSRTKKRKLAVFCELEQKLGPILFSVGCPE